MRRWILCGAALAWLAAWAMGISPTRARAFGALSSAADTAFAQTGERVILVRGPERTVTAIIQLTTSGDAHGATWLVPVPSQPTVSMSSSVVFARLETSTAPQYWVEQAGTLDCRSAAPAAVSSGAGAGPLALASRGQSGAYDFLDLGIDAEITEPQALAERLRREDFNVPDEALERLTPYLREGWHLVAFRLSAEADSHALRPVMLTYESDQLDLPLRAAAGDLDVQLWVFGPSQAAPRGFASLILNDARIDWLSAGKYRAGTLPSGGDGVVAAYVPRPQNYRALVSAAAGEAGGRGFVTELADAASDYRNKVWSSADEGDFQIVSTQPYADGLAALAELRSHYDSWDGLRDAVAGASTLPDGVSVDELMADPEAQRGRVQIDVPKLMQLAREHVIEPVERSAAALTQAPYLTRLYTALDADALSEDPSFTFNFELAQLNSVHVAHQTLACNGDVSVDEADWRMQLPQGGVLEGSGTTWPEPADLPATFKIVKLSETGAGEVVQDNSKRLAEALLPMTSADAFALRPPHNALAIGGSQQLMAPEQAAPPTAAKADAGCSVSRVRRSAVSDVAWAALASVLLFLRRRRGRSLLLAAALTLFGCGADDTPPLRDTANALTNVDMTLEQLRDPETCKGCHPNHYREWSASMHAYAARDPVFIAMNERGQRETQGALGDFCVKCHAPMAVLDNKTRDGLNLDQLADKQRGVSCYFCHNANNILGDHNALMSIANDNVLRGPIKDPVQPGVHQAQYSEMFDDSSPKSTEMCGGCHDIVMPSGVHLERTFAEYRYGLFSKTAMGDPTQAPPAFGSCIGCHMPGHEAQAAIAPAGAPKRVVHEHMWPGVDLALTDFPHTDAMRSAVEDCQLGALSLSFFKLEVTPPDLFTFQLETNAGHNQPSGAAEDRRLWLEFAAYDASGQLLPEASSGMIEDGEPEERPVSDPRHDPRLLMFRDRLFGADGKPVDMFWQAALSKEHPLGYESSALPVATTTYVEGKHALVKQYRASGPDGLPARVTARMRMRPIGQDVLHDLVASGDLDPAVAAKMQTLTFGTQIEWTQQDGVQKVISATPGSDCSSYRCLLDPSSDDCR